MWVRKHKDLECPSSFFLSTKYQEIRKMEKIEIIEKKQNFIFWKSIEYCRYQ